MCGVATAAHPFRPHFVVATTHFVDGDAAAIATATAAAAASAITTTTTAVATAAAAAVIVVVVAISGAGTAAAAVAAAATHRGTVVIVNRSPDTTSSTHRKVFDPMISRIFSSVSVVTVATALIVSDLWLSLCVV